MFQKITKKNSRNSKDFERAFYANEQKQKAKRNSKKQHSIQNEEQG